MSIWKLVLMGVRPLRTTSGDLSICMLLLSYCCALPRCGDVCVLFPPSGSAHGEKWFLSSGCGKFKLLLLRVKLEFVLGPTRLLLVIVVKL